MKRVLALDLERVAGCLAGLAIGDAMGMPAEFMSREEIREKYGRIDGFVMPRAEHIHAEMAAGQVTDDTQQTLALAEAISVHGKITPEIAAEAYLKWARDTNAFDSSVLGPSSKTAMQRLLNGEDPASAGSSGATVGAAMRVAPIGIANAGDLDGAAHECYLSCLPTHGVNVAIAGACAVACAVSCAVSCPRCASASARVQEVMQAALFGAEYGQRLGVKWAGASVAARIRLALRIVAERSSRISAEDTLYEVCGVGMSPTELVPTAMGLVTLYEADAKAAIIAAANMGGDTDTLASIVGAITGALSGISGLPDEWVRTVEKVNRLDFRQVANTLVSLRERRTQCDRSQRETSKDL
ncbi:MAG: ADP-ribosylglycohydrolase family protein [Firmicutes bacterium]|nr:ADP-ribosylglycohydrolase family protein [Bacillota bacterium]